MACKIPELARQLLNLLIVKEVDALSFTEAETKVLIEMQKLKLVKLEWLPTPRGRSYRSATSGVL